MAFIVAYTLGMIYDPQKQYTYSLGRKLSYKKFSYVKERYNDMIF